MTDPALLGHLRILEAKLDRLTDAILRVATAVDKQAQAEHLQALIDQHNFDHRECPVIE